MNRKCFLNAFNNILLSDLPEILISLENNRHWSNGVDNISIIYTENSEAVRSVMVTLLEIWDRGIFVEQRFSIPKFLDILTKRKKEYIQLHPIDKETVETEFETFKKSLLKKWTSDTTSCQAEEGIKLNGYSQSDILPYINRYYSSILAQLRRRDVFFDPSCENSIEYMGSGSPSAWDRDIIDYVLITYQNGKKKYKLSVPEFLNLLKQGAEYAKQNSYQHFEEWNSHYLEVEKRLLSRWSGSDK